MRLVAGLAAGAAVLSGCSDKQEASDTLPSASAEASPTEAALPPLGPADLPMPDEARTQDAAGAEAFVRYYIDLINRTSTVMDAAPLREFSDGCTECDRVATDTENDAAAGYHYEGGALTLTEIGRPLVRERTAEIPFRVDLAALTVVDQSDQPVPELSFSAYPALLSSITLQWDNNRTCWISTQLSLG
ncbi:hypothetical protein SAMN04488085_12236 [Geodermatophilus ruber]|uniref:DUF6318 domain-containing protein n=2 Tax=Geodermatophilus ruber TaxID=504800 RepID=A0A1I4LL19_9ACTN|nr:hypothetical protein SAMN04488085_12236 [Geodermatophilus ruber]